MDPIDDIANGVNGYLTTTYWGAWAAIAALAATLTLLIVAVVIAARVGDVKAMLIQMAPLDAVPPRDRPYEARRRERAAVNATLPPPQAPQPPATWTAPEPPTVG